MQKLFQKGDFAESFRSILFSLLFGPKSTFVDQNQFLTLDHDFLSENKMDRNVGVRLVMQVLWSTYGGYQLFRSRTKISEKFLKILEGYQNIRKLKNIESTKISEN